MRGQTRRRGHQNVRARLNALEHELPVVTGRRAVVRAFQQNVRARKHHLRAILRNGTHDPAGLCTGSRCRENHSENQAEEECDARHG